jgi:glc operon protein GlcG
VPAIGWSCPEADLATVAQNKQTGGETAIPDRCSRPLFVTFAEWGEKRHCNHNLQETDREAWMSTRIGLLGAAVMVIASAAQAQAPPAAPPPPPAQYGPTIGIEDAKKAAAAAIAEVGKAGSSPDAVAIVDAAGYLVYFEKMDNTQYGSVRVAIDKARSAALFRRPTKAFQDALAGGGAGMRILELHGAMAIEGGVPIMSGGKIIGAIGASGGTAEQDGQVAGAGAAVIK